jgi:hypothetical protein
MTKTRGFKVFFIIGGTSKILGRGSGARLGAVRGPRGDSLRSSWNLAFCGPKNVLQRLQNIKCFWKKNTINFLFRVQISPRPCIMDFSPQFLYWIFQLTDFSQDYSWIVCHILTKPLLSNLKLLKILLLALSFSFSQYVCVFFYFITSNPLIKLIKDHWHESRHISVIINETYKFNLQSSLIKIYNFNK